MKVFTIIFVLALLLLPTMAEERWEKIPLPPGVSIKEGTYIYLDYFAGPWLLAGEAGHLVVGIDSLLWETKDNGVSWENVGPKPTAFALDNEGSIHICPTPCFYSPGGDLYSGNHIGGGGAVVWQDSAWQELPHEGEKRFSFVIAVAFGPQGEVYIGFRGPGITHKDADHEWEDIAYSNTWLDDSAKTLSRNLSSLAVDSSGALYASYFRNLGSMEGGGGIVKIRDHGAEWDTLTKALPETTYSSLVFDKNQRLFAGTEGRGVFTSSNFGKSWSSLNTGLTDMSVVNLTKSTEGKMYVLTYDGIYQLVDTDTRVEAPLGKYPGNRISVRPNPFNPRTTIVVDQGAVSRVQGNGGARISIYDLNGHLIRKWDHNTGSVVWNGQDFGGRDVASGTYLVRVRVGKKTFKQKVVLAR